MPVLDRDGRKLAQGHGGSQHVLHDPSRSPLEHRAKAAHRGALRVDEILERSEPYPRLPALGSQRLPTCARRNRDLREPKPRPTPGETKTYASRNRTTSPARFRASAPKLVARTMASTGYPPVVG